MEYGRVFLKTGKEKPVRAFHPWIFSGAIDRLDDTLKAGDLAKVHSAREEFLGIGYFNPESQITVRMLSFKDEPVDLAFFVHKLAQAKKLREDLMPPRTNAIRWVHSEGDFLPGLIVDRYGDYLSVQFLTKGIQALHSVILEAIQKVFQPKGVCERIDPQMRRIEGIPAQEKGETQGELPEKVEIEEYGYRFWVDIKGGQKTGFFLDQRENRKLVGAHANGKKVLNCFAYSGGFSVYAAAAGAQTVTSVEIGKRAVELMKANFELNHLSGPQYQFIAGDVFDFLRQGADEYSLIILDPPAFCRHKSQILQASRGYKDINLWAMKRLASGGLLFTSSCSSFISPDLFQKIVFGAAKDAGREVQIIQKTSHSMDHPINIYHPEGEYLKGLFLRVI